jgi:hypothetical protein
MKPVTRHLALAGLFLLSAGGASAEVTVAYTKPEQFADMPFEPWERERVLQELTAHFNKLGKALPAGETLRVEVLDLDLAGRLRPNMRTVRDLRVLNNGADWPHMHLRYSVEADGKVIRSGDDQLSNMNYMNRHNRYQEGDFLRYEKQMIDDWFNKAVLPKRAG